MKVEPVIQTIHKHALRWFGHITRMSEDRKTKQVFEARPEGTIRRECPRKEWIHYIGKITEKKGKINAASQTTRRD